MKKTEEVQEITLLTNEQIEALPKEAVKTVKSLNESLSTAQLQIFIPVVQSYIDLRDKAVKLKLEKNENGEVKKESISEYKSIKAEQRTLNGLITSKIKLIKNPINAIRTDIIAVEKTFKSESDKIKEAAEKEFEEYEKIQAEIAAEKQRKKDEALNAKVNEAKATADEATLKLQKTTAYNAVKYEIIGESIKDAVNEAVLNANKNRLLELQDSITKSNYDDAIDGNDVSILDDNVQTELREYFNVSKANSLKMLSERLKAIETETENVVMKATSQQPTSNIVETAKAVEQAFPGIVPFPPVPRTESLSDDEFIEYAKSEIEKILNMVVLRLETNPASKPELYDLRNKLSDI